VSLGRVSLFLLNMAPSTPTEDALGWVLGLLFLFIIIALIDAVIHVLWWALKKVYSHFVKKEVKECGSK